LRYRQRESIQIAFTLLLGPKTSHHSRVQAIDSLLAQQKDVLPLLLQTLNTYPEIVTPAWPWSPPQYTYIARLLLQLCQKAQVSIESLLVHPALTQLPGPVLWTSLISTINLLTHEDHEAFLCQALKTQWSSVRYAAAMALAARARCKPLHQSTQVELQNQQGTCKDASTSFAIAYAEFMSGLPDGLHTIITLLQTSTPTFLQKATVFLLATDQSLHLVPTDKKRIALCLLPLLLSSDQELAQNAAIALSTMLTPATLKSLYSLLATASVQQQNTLLIALEEMAHRPGLRNHLRYHSHLVHMLPLLQSVDATVRRQTCYTLASIGGEYATAVLGTVVLEKNHVAHNNAIESLRYLYKSNRASLRIVVIRWLLQAMGENDTLGQVQALDAFTFLLWQAHENKNKTQWRTMSKELLQHGGIQNVLQSPEPAIRQKAIKMLAFCDSNFNRTVTLHPLILCMLRTDKDRYIRTDVVALCKIMKARWALPDLLQTLLDPDIHVAHMVIASLEAIATTKDTTVVCALIELVQFHAALDATYSTLAHDALGLLQKWCVTLPDGIPFAKNT
jgi:HEAT repeat protein